MHHYDLLAITSTEGNVSEGIAFMTLRGTESFGIEGLDGLVPVLGIAMHVVGRDEDLGLTGVSARVTRNSYLHWQRPYMDRAVWPRVPVACRTARAGIVAMSCT